jgi:hypothetical protein
MLLEEVRLKSNCLGDVAPVAAIMKFEELRDDHRC